MVFYVLFIITLLIITGRYRVSPVSPIVNRDLVFKFAVFFIIFIAAFRFNVGFDWKSYLMQIYPKYNPKTMSHFEPLSGIFIKLGGITGFPFIMYLLFAITNYLFIAKAIKENSVDNFESLMLYICLFYFDSLSTMRQATAVAITFYGFKFIKEKNIWKYIITCFIACLFHKTAILAFPIYFIYNFKSSSIFFLMAFTVFLFKILIPLLLERFFPLFLSYYEGTLANQSGNIVRLVYLLIYIYLFLLKKNDQEYIGLLNICSIGIVFPFALGGLTGGRVAQYFLIYFLLLIPRCNRKYPIEYRVIFLIPFYLFFLLLLNTGKKYYIPYRFYFLENLNSLNLEKAW